VFDDVFACERFDFDNEHGEIRSVITGMVKDVVLTVVYTERGERIRIISARKATKHESKENIVVAKRQSDGTVVSGVAGWLYEAV
jgi:uncharacterized DUF497 family protein